jgi:hypothetical protein
LQYSGYFSCFSVLLKVMFKAVMMVHVCDPSIWEAEKGGLWVQGQPGLPCLKKQKLNKLCSQYTVVY